MSETEYQFVDHLKLHMLDVTRRHLERYENTDLPVELRDINRDRLLELIVEAATPILCSIESTAIESAIETTASMIRFAQKKQAREKGDK